MSRGSDESSQGPNGRVNPARLDAQDGGCRDTRALGEGAQRKTRARPRLSNQVRCLSHVCKHKCNTLDRQSAVTGAAKPASLNERRRASDPTPIAAFPQVRAMLKWRWRESNLAEPSGTIGNRWL